MMHCGGTEPSNTAAITTTLVSSVDSSSSDSLFALATKTIAATHAC